MQKKLLGVLAVEMIVIGLAICIDRTMTDSRHLVWTHHETLPRPQLAEPGLPVFPEAPAKPRAE
jgi:hypothetical protein